MKSFIFIMLTTFTLNAQIKFDDFFYDKTLRFDYVHSGDAVSEYYSFDEMIEEPFYGGSKINLIDDFNFGEYFLKVYDKESGKLIYSRGYSSLFGEYQTTEEAKTVVKSFDESVVFPYPKNNAILELYSRNRKGKFEKMFTQEINPQNYFIKTERRKIFPYFTVHNAGHHFEKLDIVVIPEGYQADEMDLFKEDCQKFKEFVFAFSPFKESIDKINIHGVLAISEESGADVPADNIWKKTILNSNFYTFDSDRYIMTEDYKSVRDVAANAPYDQIYILVNTDIYGGGAIYNYYSCSVMRNPSANKIIPHEFGHALVGLADEYWTSEVSYQEFYPLDVEPWEVNITTLVDFESKWKNLIKEDVPIPTPPRGDFKDDLGVFEGGGYVAKGIYRPTYDSIMKSLQPDYFNEPSRIALQKIIDFYSE